MNVSSKFLWGGALSNVQAEGAVLEGGKGLNVYDELSVIPEKGQRSQQDVNIASNHYHQFKEDIELMKEMGFKAYRFSIIWSRINPSGLEKEPNQEGLKFYDQVVDELLKLHIEPVVSLVHFDMPANLSIKYNGFLNPKVIDLYLMHVRQVVNHFKDRVKYWITYNEINTAPFDNMSYLVAGAKRPKDMSQPEFFHHIFYNTQKASSEAVNLIRELEPSAQISEMITLNKIRPKRDCPSDRIAASIQNKFNFGLFEDLIRCGAYPDFYKKWLALNHIDTSSENLAANKLAAKNLNFLSVSCYQTRVVSTNLHGESINEINKIIFNTPTEADPNLKASHWGWTIDPVGFRLELNELYSRTHLPIFIVENGIGLQEGKGENDIEDDTQRINYHRAYIKNMIDAISLDGVDIFGYLIWSPIDILSSHKEMGKRYGFIYVKPLKDGMMKRIPKKSFYWYKKVIESNGGNLNE